MLAASRVDPNGSPPASQDPAPGGLPAAAAAPLGITTKLVARTRWQQAARRAKATLRQAVRSLLPDSRVNGCGRQLARGETTAEVVYSDSRQAARWRNVRSCGSVWLCAVCSDRVSAARRDELRAAIDAWRAGGGVTYMVTFTFAHYLRQPLADVLARFLSAHRKMHQGRRYRELKVDYGLAGWVKALEVTWGLANGWHPHLHVVYFAERPIDDVGAFQDAFYAAWEAAAGSVGLSMTPEHGLDVRAAAADVDAYVTKFGRQPERRPWDAADEMTRAHSKRAGRRRRGDRPDESGDRRFTPFDLLRWWLDEDAPAAAERFREYAAAFEGRSQLQWSPGLRALVGLGDETPDELVPEDAADDERVVLTLGRFEFNVVAGRGRQLDVLELVEDTGPAAARAYVDELVAQARASPLVGPFSLSLDEPSYSV